MFYFYLVIYVFSLSFPNFWKFVLGKLLKEQCSRTVIDPSIFEFCSVGNEHYTHLSWFYCCCWLWHYYLDVQVVQSWNVQKKKSVGRARFHTYFRTNRLGKGIDPFILSSYLWIKWKERSISLAMVAKQFRRRTTPNWRPWRNAYYIANELLWSSMLKAM